MVTATELNLDNLATLENLDALLQYLDEIVNDKAKYRTKEYCKGLIEDSDGWTLRGIAGIATSYYDGYVDCLKDHVEQLIKE